MSNDEKEIIVTKEGHQKLRQELDNLVNVERPNIIIKIKEAREQGDLSENAEFDVAREKQGKIEDRISEIENILSNLKIVKKRSSKRVSVGSKVTIENLKSKTTSTYQIVGTIEANPIEKKISNLSPLAKALLNKEEGDEVTIESGNKYSVIIKKVD